MKEKSKNTIRSIILMVLVFSFIALFISRCGFAIVPVTTRYAYQPILKYRWETKNIVEHFPPEIPDEANNIKFYYRAGLMQGGTTIELRMRLPERAFDAVVEKHRPMAKWILDQSGNYIDAKTGEKVDVEISLKFYTLPSSAPIDEYNIGPLPVGYEIILLHLKGNWNHGKTAGIAVSQARKEMIYWAEVW